MYTFKNLAFLLLLSTIIISLSSCHKHEGDDNVVTIEIISPSNGSKVANAKAVKVNVKFSATVEMHELEIKLHPDANTSNNIIDFDKHTHNKTFEFNETVDLSSFPAGTKFHLEVQACEDHDCAKIKKAEAEFTN